MNEENQPDIAVKVHTSCGELRLDEESGALHLRFIGETTADGAATLLGSLIDNLEHLPRRLVILDLSEASPWIPAEVRRTLSERSKAVKADRQAFIVTNPVVRMMAKTMVAWLGADIQGKFVANIEEARLYLNG